MTIGSILLAAGQGKRLRPLTNDIAKPAVPVLDVPLGAWGLAALVRAAPPVIVNGSHAAQSLETALRVVIADGWELFHEGPEGFGTAGTIAALSDRITSDVVVCNGDLVSDIDVNALLDEHRRSEADITLAVEVVDSAADVTVEDGWVREFIDRRRADEPGARYLGVAVLSANAAKSIPHTRPLGLGESVFAPLTAAGRLRALFHEGYALDVGTIDRYLQVSQECVSGAAPAPPIAFPGSIVEVDGGRAYIGPGARADDGTLGPGAVLLRESVVADGAWVERSVVYEKEVVTPGHEVRDAVWIDDRAITGSSARPAP